MFDKLKEFKKLKDLQAQLGQEKVEIEKDGVRVTINGKMEVEVIQLNAELSKEEQENIVKNCINEAIRKIQAIAAQKMFRM